MPRIPGNLVQALEPEWLSQALAAITGGAQISRTELLETAGSVATSARFRVWWDGGSADLCLKAFFADETITQSASGQRLNEQRFYQQIAPHLRARMPEAVSTLIEEDSGRGLVIMRDLISAGGHFGSALDPLGPDDVARSLEQIALVHAGARLLEGAPWIRHVVSEFASWNIVTPERLQDLLQGPKGRNLMPQTRQASRLINALNALARHDALIAPALLHGDCHAGNFFWTADREVGLADWQVVQRGGWALDVAYHIGAVLPVEVAAANEWALLDHYLEFARGLGNAVPDREEAQRQYRMAMIYGFYMWAITTKPPPPVIETFADRLGQAVERLDSFAMVGM